MREGTLPPACPGEHQPGRYSSSEEFTSEDIYTWWQLLCHTTNTAQGDERHRHRTRAAHLTQLVREHYLNHAETIHRIAIEQSLETKSELLCFSTDNIPEKVLLTIVDTLDSDCAEHETAVALASQNPFLPRSIILHLMGRENSDFVYDYTANLNVDVDLIGWAVAEALGRYTAGYDIGGKKFFRLVWNLAANPSTPHSILASIAQKQYYPAQTDYTDPERWRRIGTALTRSSQHTPPHILHLLATSDSSPGCIPGVLWHQNTGEETFQRIAAREDFQQLSPHFAAAPNCPDSILAKIAATTRSHSLIAENPRTPSRILDLVAQQHSGESAVLNELARHPNLSPFGVDLIVKSGGAAARRVLVQRPYLEHAVLALLAADSDPKISAIAQKRATLAQAEDEEYVIRLSTDSAYTFLTKFHPPEHVYRFAVQEYAQDWDMCAETLSRRDCPLEVAETVATNWNIVDGNYHRRQEMLVLLWMHRHARHLLKR